MFMTVLYTCLPLDRLRVERGRQMDQTFSLIGAARLVFQEGNPKVEAQLLGAVLSGLKALNAVMETHLKPFYEGTLAKAREALGDGAFQSAWERRQLVAGHGGSAGA
jgi:hypothetical protein